MKRKRIITRRKAIITGLGSLGALIAGCSADTPPTYGNLLRMGDALTYNAQRALMTKQTLAKEYSYRDISSFPATGTINPADTNWKYYSEVYDRLYHNQFSDYRISVEGSVTRPTTFSIADLQKLAARTQITRHTCEEGWTAIAQWTGVQLSTVLEAVGIKPSARFVNFTAFDGFEDSIDLYDAFHPQTLLVYGMNGKDLLVAHGAPLRLRIETQIGYKSMKYLSKIVVTDSFVDLGDNGWAWYTGI